MSVFARGKEPIYLFPSILVLTGKLTDEGPDHTIECLLARIVKVEVEVD
jgi:hypothetical protein